MSVKTKTEPATWPLARLRPHPRQALLFRDLSDHELEELTEDIGVNGLRHRVEITPGGVIIAGHQRVRALRKLGRKTVPVLVRHDLGEQGEGAVEEHLIGDNLRRRHLDPLELARCYVRLREIEKQRPLRELMHWEKSDLRDRIARRLGLSGRALDRCMQILRLPLPLQQAVSAGELSQRQAVRIESLKPGVQKEIADAVASGTPVREALSRHLLPASSRHRLPCDALAAFARHLERGLADLGDRVDEVAPLTGEAADTLRRARNLLDRLLRRQKARPVQG